MFRATFLPLTSAILLLGAAASGAAQSGAAPGAATGRGEATAVRAQGEAQAATKARAATPARPVYGPITSRDPAVRAEVKRLYEQRNDLIVDTRARLAELGHAYLAETDGEARLEMTGEIAKLKSGLEVRCMELSLEIARLNENAPRIAELEKALDQVRNPGKYRPAPADPAVQQERLRAREAADGGAR